MIQTHIAPFSIKLPIAVLYFTRMRLLLIVTFITRTNKLNGSLPFHRITFHQMTFHQITFHQMTFCQQTFHQMTFNNEAIFQMTFC